MAVATVPSSYPVVDGVIQAPQLELNVVENCNLSCRSCSHLSPVLSKHRIDAGSVEQTLALLSRHYHATWLKVVGGEPLLHPDLISIVHEVRRTGVVDGVYLVTNGVLLPRKDVDFWREFDWVEVSLYPGKSLSEEEQATCEAYAREAGTKLTFRRRHNFRTSYSEIGTSDARLTRAIYRTCGVAHDWRCHTVAGGRFYKCPQSYFLPQVLDGCAGDADADSIPIDESEHLGQKLLAFLESREPLETCRHCLGTAGKEIAHTQVKRAEFRSLQQLPTEELIDPQLIYR
jgi:organic radical activating enzyme